MLAQDAVDLARNALVTALLIGAPVLIVGMVVGLIVGLFQALTQIQDQTIAFVPKIIAMIAALGFALPWLIHQMVQYSHDLIVRIPLTLAGG
jgi:flagellar biosynthetic protein FliQ